MKQASLLSLLAKINFWKRIFFLLRIFSSDQVLLFFRWILEDCLDCSRFLLETAQWSCRGFGLVSPWFCLGHALSWPAVWLSFLLVGAVFSVVHLHMWASVFVHHLFGALFYPKGYPGTPSRSKRISWHAFKLQATIVWFIIRDRKRSVFLAARWVILVVNAYLNLCCQLSHQ